MRNKKTPKIKTSYNSISCNSFSSLHFYYIFLLQQKHSITSQTEHHFYLLPDFSNKLDFHQKERFCFILGKKIICTTKEQEILHRIWRLLSQSSIKQEYRALSHSVQNKEKEVCSPITTRGYLTIIETSAEFSLHGRCNLEFS